MNFRRWRGFKPWDVSLGGANERVMDTVREEGGHAVRIQAPHQCPDTQRKEGPMNHSGVSAREPVILGAATVALIEGAIRDLEDFGGEIMTPGHWPSWTYPEVPDGLALCLGCWRPITAWQLGVESCPGARSGWRNI
jgi:hypothetical protein